MDGKEKQDLADPGRPCVSQHWRGEKNMKTTTRRRRRRRRRKVVFKADAVNEEDPERDRATPA